MSNSIVITNFTDAAIDVVSVQDNPTSEEDRNKVHTVLPKNSVVLFLSHIESITWSKKK